MDLTNFIRTSLRKRLLEDYKGIDRTNPFKVLDDYTFNDEHTNYYRGQHDFVVRMFDKENKTHLATAEYSTYEDEVHISFIKSIVKGAGYGKILMIFLAKKYGYENLERTGLTPEGAKMRQELDALFNFDYNQHQESKSRHLDRSIIDKISQRHKEDAPEIGQFLDDMTKIGYEDTWKKWVDHLRTTGLMNRFDFNDISEIPEWIKGSVTNRHNPKSDVPEPVTTIIADLLK